MAISIAKLTEAMLLAVFAFERRLSEEEPGYYNWTEEAGYEDKVRASFSGGIFDQALTLVALHGDDIVGRIDAALIPTHFDGSVKAYLDWICVLKSCRHQGVAQALMQALRRDLRTLYGVDTLIGLIAGNPEAQRFYRALPHAVIRDEGIWIDC